MLTLGDIPMIAVLVIVGIIVMSVCTNILASMATSLYKPTVENNTYYALTNGTSILVNIFTNLPVLGIVIAGAIVIGVLISVFPTGGRGV